jgi:hypothetical protein
MPGGVPPAPYPTSIRRIINDRFALTGAPGSQWLGPLSYAVGPREFGGNLSGNYFPVER